MGQEALRQGWGHSLYDYVMAWGSTPTRPETREALKRRANDFLWDLGDMRKIENPDKLTQSLQKLYEAAFVREAELRKKFLRCNDEE